MIHQVKNLAIQAHCRECGGEDIDVNFDTETQEISFTCSFFCDPEEIVIEAFAPRQPEGESADG